MHVGQLFHMAELNSSACRAAVPHGQPHFCKSSASQTDTMITVDTARCIVRSVC